MKTLKHWKLTHHDDHHVELTVDDAHTLCLWVLEPGLFRVAVKRRGAYALKRTWSIAPENDVPWEGRARDSLAGFSLPGFTLEETPERLTISSERLRVTVHQPLWLEWHYRDDRGRWQFLTSDRPTSAYLLNAHGDGVAHYQRREKDDRYYGLGEKAGDLERTGRRFEMRNLDAMGYNAASTDPLYKHIPFTITRREQVSFGLFYDNLSSCWLDLGNEIDNYHQPYRRWQAEAGDIDYYLFVGPRVLDVTKAFVRLTGKTLFGPKWSLGYSGSTMHYTDAPDAQDQLMNFIRLCDEQAIPCDSFQLSSGYTSINNKRYVFNWNYDKVPQPKTMSAAFHDAGLKLAANIKPCLLQDHPRYQEVARQGLFIRDSETDAPERSSFWDDEGSHLDFTNPATVAWWQNGVTTQLLEMGIDSTWNDNNEYEVWDGEARCHGFGEPVAIKHIRPVMPLLMMRASMEAQQRFAPEKRPYLISRSGCAGMQRYVQTWSGDNRTSWQTLRYNIRMGLGMSLSGLYNVGHDVGGFSGDKPDAELFVRWVQNGVMHPRFTIHSWNDDHTVNEPWMYPAVTPAIRSAIELRYRLLPYLYTLLWQAHADDEPMLRPTFLDHEHDAQTFRECDEFMLGRDLLVASVVEPGARTRTLWLPANDHGWYDFHTGSWYAGGQQVTLDAPLERLPLLVRAGAGLPLSERIRHVDAQRDDTRELKLFPVPGNGQASGLVFEDDGESWGYQDGNALWVNWQMRCTAEAIQLTFATTGDYRPAWASMSVTLPPGETRRLVINGEVTDRWVR
ncbi:glycoside hydrolase family 31 protein [Cronobacter dublinensis]|uniref:glycoside hydrolase family 31 protein n=1 Tax=Cronobacter dublinensis TaxID=413497 RepID=UPI0013762643|nr:glycoside hydrolase family 31 protein [Cronobacter dublinensis]EKY3087480.1 glycoside hydrolase family 31 protein [Cronobacter dublinensis]ELQ6227320.1 glycoside hydrolase family 31 protein [Cronobacter dublinensis]ELY4004415.1 glycoside hydrolase family 31 protein [Cronobacter dublinensis]ELY4409712.1 glycoside hydrolase family 31 protein [Cronobacter dublinensis]ELY5818712.1 glycoside hydrolase family 31 protein [Cronobacter dublinensis]